MKIILKESIQKIGNKNEVVEVSDGYAQNSLIPRGLAVAATPQALKNLEKQKNEHKKELKQEAQDWLLVKKEIESKEFIDYAKSNDGIMIGNFSRKHALDLLNKNLSVKLNKKQLPKDYIFGMGTNTYPLNLFPHIEAKAKIIIKEK